MPERKERNKEGKREHEEGNKTILKRRKGRNEGRKEGRKKGRKEGRKKGRKEGKKEERKEGKDARIEDYDSQ